MLNQETPSRWPLILGIILVFLCVALAGTTIWLFSELRQPIPTATLTPYPTVPLTITPQVSPTTTPTIQPGAVLPIPEIPSDGNILYVAAYASPGGDGSQGWPFRNPQEAVEAAAPGDTILISVGTYNGVLVIHDTSLTIIGGFDPATWLQTHSAQEIILNAGGEGRAVTIWNSQVEMQMLTITGGHNHCLENDEQRSGGGMGIFGDESQVVLQRLFIAGNTVDAPCGGGGMDISEGADAWLINNVIVDNDAGDGGGVLLSRNAYALIINCTITGNRVQGLHVMPPDWGSQAVVVNTIFWENDGEEIAGANADVRGCLVDVDPQFVSPGFHLGRLSPARDIGLSMPEVPEVDMDGNHRPGSGADIGAYEYLGY